MLVLQACAQAMTISGTVTYAKTVYAKTGPTTTTTAAVEGATITATGGTTGTFTTTTASDGTYTLDIGSNSTYSIVIQPSGSGVLVGSSVSGSSISGVLSVSLASGFTSSTRLTNQLSGTGAETFNVFVQLLRGVNWMKSKGLTPSRTVNCLYPSTQGTQFNPTDFYLIVQKLTSDPDAFDDDIILHEFGHWVAEEFFKDSS